MTTLSFDAGYAMFQSDSALFGQIAGTSALRRKLGWIASSARAQTAADFAGRTLLSLVPFSTLAWIFVTY